MAAIKDRGNFAQGAVSSNILRLAGPMIIAQMINVLYNLVDRMYIGRLAETGSFGLTGIGICAPILSIIMAFANLCGMGGSPLFSMARGRDDDKDARHIMGNAFFMMIFLGIILTVIVFAIKNPLLYRLGADANTYIHANQYLSVYLIGNIAVMISLGMNPFINAQGAGRTGMLTVAIGAVINIILDPIFIFALDMGVSGAALATIISQAASAAWVLAFLCGKRASVKFSLSDMRPKASTIKKITLLGTSGFCLSFTTSLVQMLCNTSLRDLGGTMYIGIMTIINSIKDLFFVGANGLTNGSTPVISYNYGAGKYSRVREAIRFTTISAVGYCFVAWIVIMLFPRFFISIFNSDPELLKIGVPAFRMYFAAIVFMAFQLTGQVVSLALGKSKTAIFFSLLRKVIVMAPLIIILPKLFGLGVNGVFLAEPVSNVIGGLACFITMMLTVYRPLKNKADEPDRLPE